MPLKIISSNVGDADLALFAPRLAGFVDTMQKAGLAVAPKLLVPSRFGGQMAGEQTR